MNSNIAKWIWFNGETAEVNNYVNFRREFDITDELLQYPAELRISCETNFAAWLNGELIGTGQFGDYPETETYSFFDLNGKMFKGTNVLAVTAYHCGVNNASYIAAEPALWFELRTADEPLLCSGNAVMSRISPLYRQGEMKRSTVQMGFSFEADMRKDDQWRELEFEMDKSWYLSREISDSQPNLRPLPVPVIRKRTSFQIIAQGTLKRRTESGGESVMQHDYLSARRSNEVFENIRVGEIHRDKPVTICMDKNEDADGMFLVVDMQREECGFIELELDAPAGMIVDMAVGEHLADLRVRASIDGRTFSTQLITKDGKQHFTHYITRAAGRYLQLHFTDIADEFTLEYAGILPFEYPLAPFSEFNCADSLFNKIYEVSCRTLELCMHEHYEDCPWREQALYANDSRNQALVGYYTFGEYAFPEVSFELLGRSAGDDGYLTLCAPMNSPFTIPSFTMVWFLALADHLRYSGNFEYAKANLPLIHKCLKCFTRTVRNRLLPSLPGPGYWHFYDWADGLSGTLGASPNTDPNTECYDAPLNFLFILALCAAAEICEACGEKSAAASYRDTAAGIVEAAHEMFWNPEKQLYCTGSSRAMSTHFAELTQAFALLAAVPPSSKTPDLRARLAQSDNGMVKTTLSQRFYKFEALLQEKEKYGSTVFAKISDGWSRMLYAGATSFWETELGQADFNYAGSLCHGWSAIPAYFFGAYMLGVKPLSPGFKTFAAEPVTGEIPRASGSIPTPSGDIKISWHINIDEKGNKSPLGKIIYPDCLMVASKPEYLKLEPYSVN